jgi:hypothetical protein
VCSVGGGFFAELLPFLRIGFLLERDTAEQPADTHSGSPDAGRGTVPHYMLPARGKASGDP